MKRRIPALCSNEQAASSSIKRTKVHAQRKFAQGSNNFVYTSPKILSKSPESSVSSAQPAPQPTNRVVKPECELNNFSSLPTIDDFLTFLCFRETEVLPQRLNYLNTPQLNAPPSKKKLVKSNSVSFQEPKGEDGRDSNCRSNGKSKSSLKKKNKTKVPEYTLRSRPSKSNIARKPSHSLALKHNQRLRSKSVVKAKCSENKLQSLKNKTAVLAKVIPHSSHSITNISPSSAQTMKARPLTRALDKKVISPLLCDDDFKRVTRRNSTIDRNESLSQHCANHAIKKIIRMRPVNHTVKKVVPATSKKSTKTIKASLPKNKSYVTDSNSDSTDTPSKPVTRSTRSGSALRETTAPSTTSLRPSRRTKEAAALYMEMLGKELLCPDESFDDDDNISVESFPELPNTEELNRREKEIKEMHLKKNAASKSTAARKTSTPKPRAVARVPLPEPVTASKASPKSVPIRDKAATTNVSDDEDAKRSGLCTRSKQYKPDIVAPPTASPALTARKEQPSASASVKIIRTRLKNDIVAAAAAAGANMGRRNSYNDAFDVAKYVSGFAKEFLVGHGKQPKSKGSADDIETAGSGAAENEKKASETGASTESVTIKRLLSIAKYGGGDEKSRKASASRPKDDPKVKKFLGLGCARRSSEPVNIEQLKSSSGDDLKSVKSLASDSSGGNEAELRRPEKALGKCGVEKTPPAHAGTSGHSRSALSGNGGTVGGANKGGNGSAGGDPVIIERIPSRKNSELKSTKRNRCATSDEKAATSTKTKVEEMGGAKSVVADCKPADTDRRSSFAETKSKVANHNLSVKSLKPAPAGVDARAKKVPVTATTSIHQKAVTKVKHNCVVKPTKAVKSDSSVCVDTKTAKPKVPVAEVEKKKPSLYDLMTFDDSDDDFLIPPKAPKAVIEKATKRVDSDDEIPSPPKAPKPVVGKATKRIDSDDEILIPVKTPKPVIAKATKRIDSDDEILIPPKTPKPVIGRSTKRIDSDDEILIPPKATKPVIAKSTKQIDSDDEIQIPVKTPKPVIAKSTKRIDSDDEILIPPKSPKPVSAPKPVIAPKLVIAKSTKQIDSDDEIQIPVKTPKPVIAKSSKRIDSDDEILIPPRAPKPVIGKPVKRVDSDDEFLIAPKVSKAVIGKPTKRVDGTGQTDVSSTNDHRQRVPKKGFSAATGDAKCSSIDSAPKTARTLAKEIVSRKESPVFRAENAFGEKHAKPAPAKVTNAVVHTVVFDKVQTPKRSNACVVDEIIGLVTPKREVLDDSCENQTFALHLYDDSTEDCEKMSSAPTTPTTPLKKELVVATSTCGGRKAGEMSGAGKTGENSVRSNCAGAKNPADFKKPVPQPPKSFFSAASACLKLKAVKEEKPPPSPATSPKVVSVDSKKLIFKKNSYLTPTAAGSDMKDENGAKKSEAFSPDNENSVYAFEPDLPTTSPPFRRLKQVTPPKSICNSIAVQVNFENDGKIECSGSGDTQVSSTTDCEDRVFYIPIPTSADTTSTLGVAVKLDTDGLNQKIIMSAKLITDSTTFATSSMSTSISSKSTCVETCCTQTEPTKVSSIETATRKPESTVAAARKGNAEKAVTSSDVTRTIQIPCTSASSSTKITKKSPPTLPKPSSQSVKIVKLNKNKKLKELEMESLKSKSRPVKPKSAKKSSPPSASDKTKAPSKPVGEILEAPTFYPSADEFSDPLEYIDTIRSVAEKFGLCRIVPPANFRPECKVADEMRFTAYNQYVHKMLHRWGPNVKEMMAIKKFLSTQKIALTQAPLIGGMEIDLPRLYQIVQQCGGLNAVIEKERWHQVADIMKIPKLAQDRITKLDYIYCKYLLPYDVLSHDEREKLFEEIEKEWSNHLKNPNDDDIFDDVDECIVKGRTMPLSSFYRIARNTMMMCFGNAEGQEGPSTEKIEEEFWNHVSKRKAHVCVHSGSIDSGTYGYGFSMAKNSTFRKHPWNLKVLTNNSASILRSLGPVMGVTVPTLHVGMLYSACCWYRDPHGLPWIEYLHTGANKIWYGIPDEHSEQFKEAMLLLVPRYCRDKKIWLPSDTVMIPPPLLTAQNISLSRVVQHPGQFIVVFPKAFTSSISTGYLVSESVYFAHASWLNSAKQVFKDMQDSCEPSVFSLDQLLINIAEDARSSVAILNKLLPLLTDLHDTEVALRNQLKELGLNSSEKMNTNKKRKSKSAFSDEDLYECDVCRTNLFVSMVENSHDESYYCLRHAATSLYRKPAQAKHCKILYVYTEDELQMLTEKVKCKIETKSGKKSLAK